MVTSQAFQGQELVFSRTTFFDSSQQITKIQRKGTGWRPKVGFWPWRGPKWAREPHAESFPSLLHFEVSNSELHTERSKKSLKHAACISSGHIAAPHSSILPLPHTEASRRPGRPLWPQCLFLSLGCTIITFSSLQRQPCPLYRKTQSQLTSWMKSPHMDPTLLPPPHGPVLPALTLVCCGL